MALIYNHSNKETVISLCRYNTTKINLYFFYCIRTFALEANARYCSIVITT